MISFADLRFRQLYRPTWWCRGRAALPFAGHHADIADLSDNRRMDNELIRRLPKTDLHVHLDGSLRLSTLIELARERSVPLPSESEDGLGDVFRERYRSLKEYLEGFRYTVAVIQDAEALEQTAAELAEDAQADGVRYLEVRFAPQLHVSPGFDLGEVVAAVDRACAGPRSVQRSPRGDVRQRSRPSSRGSSCARSVTSGRSFPSAIVRFFEALPGAPRERDLRAGQREVARGRGAAPKREGLPWSASIWPGQEKGYPAGDHRWPTRWPTRLPGQDRPRGRGLRPRVDLPGDR